MDLVFQPDPQQLHACLLPPYGQYHDGAIIRCRYCGRWWQNDPHEGWLYVGILRRIYYRYLIRKRRKGNV